MATDHNISYVRLMLEAGTAPGTPRSSWWESRHDANRAMKQHVSALLAPKGQPGGKWTGLLHHFFVPRKENCRLELTQWDLSCPVGLRRCPPPPGLIVSVHAEIRRLQRWCLPQTHLRVGFKTRDKKATIHSPNENQTLRPWALRSWAAADKATCPSNCASRLVPGTQGRLHFPVQQPGGHANKFLSMDDE